MALLSALLLWPAASARAAGEHSLTGGLMLQRVVFDTGYGDFLRSRFGASAVDLTGVTVAATRWKDDRIGYGLELDGLRGGFGYTTLNGAPQRVNFSLWQALVKLDIVFREHWRIGLGAGLNRLARSLEGFRGPEIVAANLGTNQGVATAETYSVVGMTEAAYRLSGPRWGVEVGLRYSVSPHYIRRDDPRPALDQEQRPVTSTFWVGGIAYVASITLRL